MDGGSYPIKNEQAQLPTSNNQNNGSFYYLLNQYGLASSVSSGSYNIATSPLYFVRSGIVAPVDSSATRYQLAGLQGYYWSSTSRPNDTTAYDLRIYPASSGSVYPSDYTLRYLGFSLRCLAR